MKMKTWYVTTGTSVFDTSRCWSFRNAKSNVRSKIEAWGNLSQAQILRDKKLGDRYSTLAAMSDWRDGNLAAKAGNEDDARTFVKEHFYAPSWGPGRFLELPAELSTLYLLIEKARAKDAGLLIPQRILLIPGSSNEKASWLLKAILDHEAVKPDLFAVTVDIATAFKAPDPLGGRFQEGIKGLWDGLAEDHKENHGENEPLFLVLTGGYKGVLVSLSFKVGFNKRRCQVYYSPEDGGAEAIPVVFHQDGSVGGGSLTLSQLGGG